MADYAITASSRTDRGKGASRRLRRLAEQVPAIVYGGSTEPANISIAHKDLVKALEDPTIFTQIIDLQVDGKTEQVLLKDLQRHPSRPIILHADFLRVDASTPVLMRVPVLLLNEDSCIGVRLQGGMIQRNLTELEVRCLPKDLPDHFEVDMAEVEVGQSIHVTDLDIPEGVEVLELSLDAEHAEPVVSVIAPRVSAADEAADAEEEAAASDAADAAASEDDE